MTAEEKAEILVKAQEWFRTSIAERHAKNTLKLVRAKEFKLNPFLKVYLANFLEGNSSPISIARALIYPRVLGTSIATSFGTHIQRFASEVLGFLGSTTDGIDIEFDDQIDGRRKYCQVKAGPNTINKDDVETIETHFGGIRRRARTNNLLLAQDDLIVGVIYGTERELSGHYKRVTRQYHIPVHIGGDFWHRLTGDEDFYHDLVESIGKVAVETNFTAQLQKVIEDLAKTDEIISISNQGGSD